MDSKQVVSDRLERRVFEVLISFGADEDEVSREVTLDELEVDSLDLVELAEIVKTEFGVTLEPEDLQHVETVGQAIELVEGQMSALPNA
jgi:acyl carrier protein